MNRASIGLRVVLACCCVGALLGVQACTRHEPVLLTGGAILGAAGDPSSDAPPAPEWPTSPDDDFIVVNGSPGSPPPETSPALHFTEPGPSPCSAAPVEVLTGLDKPHGLTVTSNHIYVGAADGIRRSGRNGEDVARVVDGHATSLAADDERLAWSVDGRGLAMKDEKDAGFVVPAADAINGIAQDEAAFYAIAGGDLVRVSKATREVRVLVDGKAGNPLLAAPAAVDDAFAYFVSDAPEGSGIAIERVGKDGEERTPLASIMTSMPPPSRLMVDAEYVYVVLLDRISRVAVAGGKPAETVVIAWSDMGPVVATQDAARLYFTASSSLFTIDKADGVLRQLLTLGIGNPFANLAVDGTDVYFDVDRFFGASPAGWVGRLNCEPP